MFDTMPHKTRIILFMVLMAVGIFTRAYRLGDKVMWGDEGFVYYAATRDSLQDLEKIYQLEQHTAHHNIITFYWIRAFGDSMAALHAQSVAWSVLTLLLFGLLVWKLFPPYAAFASMALLAVNPLLVEFAQVLRYPALAGLYGIICFGALLMLRETRRPVWFPVYVAGLLLFVFIHLYSLFTIACLGAFVLFTRRQWGRYYVPLVLVHALPLAAIIPKLMLMRHNNITNLAGAIPLKAALAHLAHVPVGGIVGITYDFIMGRTVDMHTLHPALLGLLFLVFGATSCAALGRGPRRLTGWLAASVFSGAILLGWLAMIFRSVHFRTNYYIPIVALLCMLLGLGLDRIRHRRPLAAHALLVCMVLLWGICLSRYWTRLDRPPNYRSAVRQIEQNARPGDFLNASPPYFVHIDYFWQDTIPAKRFRKDYELWHAPQNMLILLNLENKQFTEQDMLQWHREVASHYQRVWMFWLLGPINTEDRDGVAYEWMEKHYERLSSTPVRSLPYMDEYTGVLVLYRIRPVRGAEADAP